MPGIILVADHLAAVGKHEHVVQQTEAPQPVTRFGGHKKKGKGSVDESLKQQQWMQCSHCWQTAEPACESEAMYQEPNTYLRGLVSLDSTTATSSCQLGRLAADLALLLL